MYTDSLGLVHVLAKSAREERSKLRAHLQEGTVGLFTLVRGTANWRVTGAVRTENIFFTLADRQKAKESVASVIAMVRQFVRGEGNDPYFFSAFFGFLHSVHLLPDEHVRDAEYIAVLRMLAALGYVENRNNISPFLEDHFDVNAVMSAIKFRPLIIRTINEGIVASGL
jgi:recombinational DNA repair protein (RecF pathway)